MTENELTAAIIGAAIEVHRRLGPGLLETVYRRCLAYELRRKQNLPTASTALLTTTMAPKYPNKPHSASLCSSATPRLNWSINWKLLAAKNAFPTAFCTSTVCRWSYSNSKVRSVKMRRFITPSNNSPSVTGDIPEVFKYNAFCMISDGVSNKTEITNRTASDATGPATAVSR
jgi:hypothetical protein